MNVGYVGQEIDRSLLFQWIVSVLCIPMIFWCEYIKVYILFNAEYDLVYDGLEGFFPFQNMNTEVDRDQLSKICPSKLLKFLYRYG
jgi:hypothetical protein